MSNTKQIWSPSTDESEECFFRGALGTPLPTDALDVLDSDLEGHGWMGEDGFRINISRDTTKHRAFSGRVVHTTQDSYESTVQVTFFEQSPNVLATVFGDANVTVDFTGGHRKTTVRYEEDELPLSSFVIRAVEDDKTVMWVIPEGRIVEIDEVQIVHSDPWTYTVTIDCLKPATGTNPDNPASINEYTDEPGVTEPGS